MKSTSICAGAMVALAGTAAFAQDTGPSTAWSANVLPVDNGVRTISLLSVGESVNLKPDGVTPYRMVGIPDGLGAFDNGDGTFTVVMNHELGATAGVVRAHGSAGAFVSKWIISKDTLEVISGADLAQSVGVWNTSTNSYDMGTTAFARLCSGDTAEVSAFYNADTGRGTQSRIHMAGEETGAEGRAFAFFIDGPDAGTAYEFAGMGNTSFENVVANPGSGDTTIVIGLDDATPGQLYVYYGTKSDTGSEMEKAGLLGGRLYGLRVDGVTDEGADGLNGALSAAFDLADLGDASSLNGADIESLSDAAGVTQFARPEDGHWNPANPNEFIFATTGGGGVATRLWKVTFNDVTDPAAGGTIDILVTGDVEGLPFDMDNLVVDEAGQVLIQEDTGSSSRLARIWNYSLETGALTEMGAYDPEYFLDNGQPSFLTTNEESSGIISLKNILGDGWFIASSQVHYNIGDDELVEDGQLLLVYSALHNACPADLVAPFESLNFFDIAEYLRAYSTGEGKADVSMPYGKLNMMDVLDYIDLYTAGCP